MASNNAYLFYVVGVLSLGTFQFGYNMVLLYSCHG